MYFIAPSVLSFAPALRRVNEDLRKMVRTVGDVPARELLAVTILVSLKPAIDAARGHDPPCCGMSETRPGLQTRVASHQMIRTGYCVIRGSGVTSARLPAIAWAMSIRSNGSRCSGGSRST